MLKLYSNIKKYRKLLNMSQQELAEAVGYKGKSMIAQVENGRVDVPASMITKFAEALHVTETDLIKDDLEECIPGEVELAFDWYKRIENLPPDKQLALQSYLQYLQADAEHPQTNSDKPL